MIKIFLTPILVTCITFQSWALPPLFDRNEDLHKFEKEVARVRAENAKVIDPTVKLLQEYKPMTKEDYKKLTPSERIALQQQEERYSPQSIRDNPERVGELREKISNSKGQIRNVLIGFFGLYLGLGLVSAARMLMHSDSNPAAGQVAWEQFKDPAFHASLFAGAAASYWFFSRAGSREQRITDSFMRNEPVSASVARLKGHLHAFKSYSAAFGVMALIVSPLGYMMNDPNFEVCWSKSKNSATACQEFQDFWMKSPKGLLLILPSVINLITAGIGTNLIMLATGSFFTYMHLAKGITAFKYFTRPMGFAGAMITSALFFFMYDAVESGLNIEQFIREIQIGSLTLENDDLGPTVRESQGLLIKQWARLRKDWKRYVPQPKNVKCTQYGTLYTDFGPVRSRSCINDATPEFTYLLANFHNKMNEWRKIMITPTLKTYDQWQIVVGQYSKQYQVTYDEYARATSQITGYYAEKLDGKQPTTEEFWLNPQSIINYQLAKKKEIEDRLKNTDPNESNENKSKKVIEAFLQDMSNSATQNIEWPTRVGQITDIDNPYQYLLSSMICGPEVNRNEPLTKHFEGWQAKFLPPKITEMVTGDNDICDQGVYSNNINSFRYYVYANGKREVHSGLVNYLREKIRPDVVDIKTATSYFDKWWNEKVTPKVNDQFQEFQNRYINILEDKFIPALTNTKYKCFNESLIDPTDRRAVPVSADLDGNTVRKDDCPADSTQVAYGVFNSINDELMIYLRILKDIYISKNGTANTSKFMEASKKLLDELIKYEILMTDSLKDSINSQKTSPGEPLIKNDRALFKQGEALFKARNNLKVVMGLTTKETNNGPTTKINTTEPPIYADEVADQVMFQVVKLLNLPSELAKITTILNPR